MRRRSSIRAALRRALRLLPDRRHHRHDDRAPKASRAASPPTPSPRCRSTRRSCWSASPEGVGATSPTLTSAKGFAVNILSEDQKAVSSIFARTAEDRFAAVDWRTGPTGIPVLDGRGRVVRLRHGRGGRRRRPCRSSSAASAISTTVGSNRSAIAAAPMSRPASPGRARGQQPGRADVGAILEHDGRILLLGNGDGPLTPAAGWDRTRRRPAGAAAFLFGRPAVDAQLGFSVRVWDDAGRPRARMSSTVRRRRSAHPAAGRLPSRLADIDAIDRIADRRSAIRRCSRAMSAKARSATSASMSATSRRRGPAARQARVVAGQA